ncbi:hypothetical protein ACHAWX_002114 [Stephanocyclus meneghinianus]
MIMMSSTTTPPDTEELTEDATSINAGLVNTCDESGACDRDESLAISSSPRDSAVEASNNSTDRRWSKQPAALNSSEIGASQVDERAPNINIRFFRLSSRRTSFRESLNDESNNNSDSVRTGNSPIIPASNNAVQDQEMTASVQLVTSVLASSLSGSGLSRSSVLQDDSLSNQSRRSSHARDNSNPLIDATLVVENEPIEIVVAQPEGFFHRHGKIIALVSSVVIVVFVTFMTLTLTEVIALRSTPQPLPMPSSAPSLAPSYDPRPTLEIVKERGKVRCGMHVSQANGTFRYRLCQAVAAIALNSPNKVEVINVTAETRFVTLNDRNADLLVSGDTYTIEREANEATTGSQFTFSTPYYYDGMLFAGNSTFVTCAEEHKQYHECARLVICVTQFTTEYIYVTSHYTADFSVITAGLGESIELFYMDICNVVASGRLDLINKKKAGLIDSTFVFGKKVFTNDPLAFVTRSDDPEWSSVVNWATQALFFGERKGITKNSSLCQRSASIVNMKGSKLNYLNAVYCVGNYAELYNGSELAVSDRTAINTINNGTAMLYAIPYGNLGNENRRMFDSLSKTYASIKRRDSLNCGLLVQDGYFEGSITASRRLSGMGVSFCQTLASSMLHGNVYAVNFTSFQSVEISLEALNNQKVDVLVGVSADMSRNFGNRDLEGVAFSTPYFYGNQTGK